MAGFSAHNFVTNGCEHCEDGLKRSHWHIDGSYRILSGSRHEFFHKVHLDKRVNCWHCSCEGGQAREWAIRNNHQIIPRYCMHIITASYMHDNGLVVMPSPWDQVSATVGRIIGGSDYELFDGDEVLLIPAPRKLTLEEIYS